MAAPLLKAGKVEKVEAEPRPGRSHMAAPPGDGRPRRVIVTKAPEPFAGWKGPEASGNTWDRTRG